MRTDPPSSDELENLYRLPSPGEPPVAFRLEPSRRRENLSTLVVVVLLAFALGIYVGSTLTVVFAHA